jgi:hypothetical protein
MRQRRLACLFSAACLAEAKKGLLSSAAGGCITGLRHVNFAQIAVV